MKPVKTADYLGLVSMSDAANEKQQQQHSTPMNSMPKAEWGNGMQLASDATAAFGLRQRSAAMQNLPTNGSERKIDSEEDEALEDFGALETDFPVLAQLNTETKQSFQLNFLDADAVNAIKNTFAALIDLKHDTTAHIEVLNRKTHYTIKLQKAQLPVSMCDLNSKLAALQLCISGVEFVIANDGGQLVVDFAKKDRFNALKQLEGSAKRVRSSPLFGIDDLEAVDGSNKRARLNKAGKYSVSSATDFAVLRKSDERLALNRILMASPHEDYYRLFFDPVTDFKEEHGVVSAFDARLIKRIIEYGMSCCGQDTPSTVKWFYRSIIQSMPETYLAEDTPALVNAAFATHKGRHSYVVVFKGFERLNLDQLRGFHDLFPHHVTDVLIHIKEGDVSVLCNPYLYPSTKPWASTLYYRRDA